MLDGIEHALKDGERTLGITSKIILCFLRHLSAEAAMETLEQALPYRNRIVGDGLDSSAKGHQPAKLKAVLERARDLDIRVVAYAGEEGPPKYVWSALDARQVERLAHELLALEHPAHQADPARRNGPRKTPED